MTISAPDQSLEYTPRRTRPTESLTRTATRGYAYMIAQTIGSQIVNFAGFIALGWLLFKADFGLFALTTTISVGASLIRQIGLGTILVHRFAHYERWATPAFWLSCVLGFATSVLMVGIAPLAGLLYDEPQLPGLIWVMAVSMPFAAVSIIAEAKLQAQLRFRYLASVQFIFVGGTMALIILFASLGFGAYSFVIPRPIMRLIELVMLWFAARPHIRRNLEFRRWRYMFRDITHLSVANVSRFIITQCDYVVLGIFHSKEAVGAYFFAFGLSQRAIVVLTQSLRDVLFPALAKISADPQRQADAFIRASRLLTIIGAPACVLQAALAEPAFNILLPNRMQEAVLLLQILSFGTLFRLVGQPAYALIRAQGRFQTQMHLSITLAVLFLVMATIGAILGEALAVAIAVALYMAIAGPIEILVAILPTDRSWRDVISIFAKPILMSGIAIGGPWLLAGMIPSGHSRDFAMLIGIPIIGGAIYLGLLRILAPTDWNDLRDRVIDLVRHRIRPAVSPSD